MATKATARSARWAKKNKAKTLLRQRMFVALAITARQDGKGSAYFHEDADALGVSEVDRRDVANTVFDSLMVLAGAEGKRIIDAAWKTGNGLQVIR